MIPSLIGIIASSGGAAAGTGFESIATVTVGSGGVLEIDFTSIPSTYQHLQLRALYRQANGEAILMRFNGDTGSNYVCHALYGNGSTASAGAGTSRTNIPFERFGGMPTGTSMYGGAVIDILDYKDTSKYKTVRSLSGHDENGSGYINLESGLWMSTSAITSIKFYTPGNVYSQYSSFALYGIKG